MDSNNASRLHRVLSKRVEDMQNVREFEPLFLVFSKETLKNVVLQINQYLASTTGDSLKMFFDDPYDHKRSFYYVMIQLFASGRQNFGVFLDETRNNPSIKFEGLEESGEVRVSMRINANEEFRSFNQLKIRSLDETQTTSLMVDFIEKIYNR